MGFRGILVCSVLWLSLLHCLPLAQANGQPQLALQPASGQNHYSESTVILHDRVSGKYYFLVRHRYKTKILRLQRDGFYWQETNLGQIRQTLAGAPGHYVFTNGEVRIDPESDPYYSRVQYRRHRDSGWAPLRFRGTDSTKIVKSHELQPPSFENIHTDQRGNIYWTYKLHLDTAFDREFFAVPYDGGDSVELRKVDSSNLADFVGNPYASGFWIRYKDGSIAFSKGLKKGAEQELKTLLPIGSATALVQAYDKLFVLRQGQVAVLSKGGRILPFFLPQGLNPSDSFALYSSNHFKQGSANSANPGPLSEMSSHSDAVPFDEKIEERIRAQLRETVLDQEEYIDALVDLWRESKTATQPQDQVRSILLTGVLGAGQSYGAEVFAQLAYGGANKLLTVDLSLYKDDGRNEMGTSRLLGLPIGYMNQDKFKGILPEFLRDPSRGKGGGVIIFKNLDKASPSISQILTEAMSSGFLRGGDGQLDPLGNMILIFTTTKGSEKIYPSSRKVPLSIEEVQERKNLLDEDAIKQLFLDPDPNNLFDTSNKLDSKFLQNIDRAIAIGPITEAGIFEIAKRRSERWRQDNRLSKGYDIELRDPLLKHLIEVFYQPANGAMNVERGVQQAYRKVRSAIKAQNVKPSSVAVTFDGKEIVVTGLAAESGAQIRFTLPRFGSITDPVQLLSDPNTRKKFLGYEKEIAKLVYGQPEAVAAIAAEVRARKIDPTIKTPAVGLFLGPTGIGKTELAKAVAEVAYGSRDRMYEMDLGVVKDDSHLNNHFNPAKGFSGSQNMGPFERFLDENPNGGVILMDEIGNMGRDPGSKDNLLRSFLYRMLDEGKWTSGSSGKTYSLRNFAIMMTSNEGQEFFYGIPSDDLRLAIHREISDGDFLEEHLRKNHHWPEALLGRLEYSIHAFRPLLSDSRREIAQKFVRDSIQENLKLHGGELKMSQRFNDQFAETFFSHKKGGRSIRGVVSSKLRHLVNSALLEAYDDGSAKDKTIEIDVRDTYARKKFVTKDSKNSRQVYLIVHLKDREGHIIKSFEENVTDLAFEIRLATVEDTRLFVFHEAGHAVANEPSLTGMKLGWLTVQGGGDYEGYARYEQVPVGIRQKTRKSIIAEIGRALAGRAGQMLMGFEATHGAYDDLNKAIELAQKAVLELRLIDDPFKLPALERAEALKSPFVQEEIQKYVREGHDYAVERLTKRISFFRALSAHLLVHRFVDAETFQKLEEQTISEEHADKETAKKWAKWPSCKKLISI